MPAYQLSGFGEIDLNDLEDYYDAQADFKEHQISLDMNFEEYSINVEKLEAVAYIIDNMSLYDNKALQEIRQKYSSGTATKLYIEHHADVISAASAAESTVASDESKIEILLSKLYLKRIGFYPENENEFAVFDYTIGEELTQYLLVVTFKKDGDIDSLAMES